MAGYDGSIRIIAGMDHSRFDSGIRSMTGSINKFGSTLKKIAGLVGIAFGVAAIVNFGREAVKAASSLNDAWMGLESIVAGQGKSFSKAKSFINDYISDGLVPLENAVTAYKNLAARGYSTEQIEKTMTALKDAAAFGRQASYSLGDAVTSATEGLKNENSILVDNAGVTKNVAKMWDEYARSIGTTANKLTQEQKIQAEVNGIMQETRFQTGDAAKLVNTYSGQVALLGYNFQNLKVQVGNALMPIAQAALPGINAIISALTKLAKVFAQVTALLFGKSTQVKTNAGVEASASSAADATDQLASATEGAGAASKKAAKDMKGIQAGFDELNILASKASGSLDDAAGGMDTGMEIPEFEADTGNLEDVGEAFQSLGELFVKTLDDILAGIPAFRDALLEFAGNFNDFNKNLYDAFTFPGVLERVEELGQELAKAFNDLVNAIDWELWGRTLGAGLNLALQFLTDFIYTFDWVNLGKRLAEFVNGLVYEVDWYDFGRLLWAQFKIALETFAGFIIGLDMPALAKAASNIIIGFFDSMQETIANIDWGEIGRQVARFLNNIDWVGILSSVWRAVKSAILAGFEFLGGVIEEGGPGLLAAVSVLAALVGAKFVMTFGPKLLSAVETVKKFFTDLANVVYLVTRGFTNLHDAVKFMFGPGSIFAGLAALIGGAALAFTNFLHMLENGFSWANEAVMLLGIAIAAVGTIILGIPAAVAGPIALVVATVATAAVLIHEHWDEIKAFGIAAFEAIQEKWNAAGEWFNTNVVEPVAKFFGGLWETVTTKAGEAWSAVQTAWNTASAWFNDTIIKPVTEFFRGMFEGILTKASEIWEKVKGVWKEAAGWFRENVTEPLGAAFEAVVGVIKNAINGAVGAVEGLVNSVIKAVNWLISQLNKIKFDIPDWVPAVGGKSFGFNIQKVSEVKLPRLANGAVIPPNQQFAAILGDQRSGKNLEAPAALIRQMVMEGIQAAGGLGRGGNMTIIMEIDGREFGRAAYKYGTAEQQRVGVRLTGGRA